MRLVYIDEAGISAGERFAVVAAVIVDGDKQLTALERALDRVVQKWIPQSEWDTFVFHAAELFNGTKNKPVFRRDDPAWPLDRRLQVADELSALLTKHRVTVTCGFVDKTKFPQEPDTRAVFEAGSPKDKAVAVHVTAFSICSLKVDDWMRRNASNEVCLLVVEDNADARALIRDTHAYHQNKRLLGEIPEEHRRYFPLRKIKEDPLFQNKRPSSVLQLADFCAYTSKRVLNGDPKYWRWVNPFLPRLYKTFEVKDAA